MCWTVDVLFTPCILVSVLPTQCNCDRPIVANIFENNHFQRCGNWSFFTLFFQPKMNLNLKKWIITLCVAYLFQSFTQLSHSIFSISSKQFQLILLILKIAKIGNTAYLVSVLNQLQTMAVLLRSQIYHIRKMAPLSRISTIALISFLHNH